MSVAPSSKQPFPMGEREFVFLMAMMQALNALSFDVMLPALGDIAREFGIADSNRRQLVVGIYMIGGGVGSLFPGVLADRFGRRPVLFVSLAMHTALSVFCALVSDFDTLLVLRGLQGVVGGAMFVVPLAVIRDRFSGDRMARAQSLVAMVFMAVPMLAPSLGQAILLVAHWRWIFLIMGAITAGLFAWAWLRLPETLDPAYRQPIDPRTIAVNMAAATFHRASIGYIFAAALVQGAMFGYLNSSQQLLAVTYELGVLFPVVFGAMTTVMALSNFTNSRIVERFGARRVSHTALVIYICCATAMFSVAEAGWLNLALFLLALGSIAFLTGLTNANFQSIAITPFARTAGAAASVQAGLRMLIAASLGVLIGQAYDGSAAPLAGSMLACGVLSMLLVLFSERGRLFQPKVLPE